MRKVLFLLLLPMFAQAQAGYEFKNLGDSLSYALGFNLGIDIKNDIYNLNTETIVIGFLDGFKGNPPLINSLAIKKLLLDMQAELNRVYSDELNKSLQYRKNTNPGFLEENKNKDGVQTTPSGLQYKIIRQGSGKIPAKDSKVQVHYKGYFVDGRVFDSSYDRSIPNEFIVFNVIRGWIEALTMMPEGSKWILYVPPDLGYDPAKRPKYINGDDILIFEVELLKVY